VPHLLHPQPEISLFSDEESQPLTPSLFKFLGGTTNLQGSHTAKHRFSSWPARPRIKLPSGAMPWRRPTLIGAGSGGHAHQPRSPSLPWEVLESGAAVVEPDCSCLNPRGSAIHSIRGIEHGADVTEASKREDLEVAIEVKFVEVEYGSARAATNHGRTVWRRGGNPRLAVMGSEERGAASFPLD
jgi:hypothetical protein